MFDYQWLLVYVSASCIVGFAILMPMLYKAIKDENNNDIAD